MKCCDHIFIKRSCDCHLCYGTGCDFAKEPVRDVFQVDQDRMMSRMADAEMGDL